MTQRYGTNRFQWAQSASLLQILARPTCVFAQKRGIRPSHIRENKCFYVAEKSRNGAYQQWSRRHLIKSHLIVDDTGIRANRPRQKHVEKNL